MKEKKVNALVTSKQVTTKSGRKAYVLYLCVMLDNNEVINTQILVNSYDKKVARKLAYKIACHTPTKE